jgi:hypothetical protein
MALIVKHWPDRKKSHSQTNALKPLNIPARLNDNLISTGKIGVAMSQFTIDDVAPGMVLAKDAIDRNGRVLLRAETELSEKHLRMLKSWGVEHLDIVGDADAAQSQKQYPQAWLDEAESALQQHFVHGKSDHPVMAFLMQVWKQQYLDNKEQAG